MSDPKININFGASKDDLYIIIHGMDYKLTNNRFKMMMVEMDDETFSKFEKENDRIRELQEIFTGNFKELRELVGGDFDKTMN